MHVGGLFDAEKVASTEKERKRVRMEIHRGIELGRQISSGLVSSHPPFFMAKDIPDKTIVSKARTQFLKLVKEEAKFASNNRVKVALESFCYHPFIFNSLSDFADFILQFPLAKLGVLFEVGHLFQAGFDLNEAILEFKDRLLDVHIHDASLGGDFRKATHLPIGSGKINFPTLINTLHNVKYDGWLTLEIHGDEQKIVESREYLEELLKRGAGKSGF